LSINTLQMMTAALLEAEKLACVRGDRSLFTDVNFSLPAGTLLQVRGPNGSGKTSLLRILCGLMEPAGGQVRWQGENINSLDEEYAQAIAYLGHRNGIKEELTPFENLRISSGLRGSPVSSEGARAALKRVDLTRQQDLPARFLSEGQKRRSALARLIAGDASLWILDEVLASLDEAAMGLVRSLIEGHLKKGGIAVIATHQELQLAAGQIQRLDLGNESHSTSAALG
jgi:heme exporter protein A